jgi:hypothetical protein
MLQPKFMFIRLTHTGFYKDGTVNSESVLIKDLDAGYEYQTRKTPQYVPAGGFIDVPFTYKAQYSYEYGDIHVFIEDGVLTANVYIQMRNATDYGGAGGVGINLATAPIVVNNVRRLNDVLQMVVMTTDSPGYIAGEQVTVAGLTAGFLALNGTYTIASISKGQDLAGANPQTYIINVASVGVNIAQALLAGVTLTLPDGKIVISFSSAGNVGGFGATSVMYAGGTAQIVGGVDPTYVHFTPIAAGSAPASSVFVDSTSNAFTFKDAGGASFVPTSLTPYVVGPDAGDPYATITAAVAAAGAVATLASPQLVLVKYKNGGYTEAVITLPAYVFVTGIGPHIGMASTEHPEGSNLLPMLIGGFTKTADKVNGIANLKIQGSGVTPCLSVDTPTKIEALLLENVVCYGSATSTSIFHVIRGLIDVKNCIFSHIWGVNLNPVIVLANNSWARLDTCKILAGSQDVVSIQSTNTSYYYLLNNCMVTSGLDIQDTSDGNVRDSEIQAGSSSVATLAVGTTLQFQNVLVYTTAATTIAGSGTFYPSSFTMDTLASPVFDPALHVVPLVSTVALFNADFQVRVETGATASYTLQNSARILIINRAASQVTTVNLPPTPTLGESHEVKDGKGDAWTYPITINGNTHNIDGAATTIINRAYGSTTFVYNGTQWNAVSDSVGALESNPTILGKNSRVVTGDATLLAANGATVDSTEIQIDLAAGDAMLAGVFAAQGILNDQQLIGAAPAIVTYTLAGTTPVPMMADANDYHCALIYVNRAGTPTLYGVFGAQAGTGTAVAPTSAQINEALRLANVKSIGCVVSRILYARAGAAVVATHTNPATDAALKAERLTGTIY